MSYITTGSEYATKEEAVAKAAAVASANRQAALEAKEAELARPLTAPEQQAIHAAAVPVYRVVHLVHDDGSVEQV